LAVVINISNLSEIQTIAENRQAAYSLSAADSFLRGKDPSADDMDLSWRLKVLIDVSSYFYLFDQEGVLPALECMAGDQAVDVGIDYATAYTVIAQEPSI
jgi:hypothetical protein